MANDIKSEDQSPLEAAEKVNFIELFNGPDLSMSLIWPRANPIKPSGSLFWHIGAHQMETCRPRGIPLLIVNEDWCLEAVTLYRVSEWNLCILIASL